MRAEKEEIGFGDWVAPDLGGRFCPALKTSPHTE